MKDGVHPFTLEALEPEPWRNGIGITRTIARSLTGAAMQWRISVADIDEDAPFSTFPGMDRAALLLRGGLELQGAGDRPIRLDAVGEVARFAGDTALHARLRAGPSRLWNVMTLRGVWHSNVRLRDDDAEGLGRQGPAVILVVAGRLAAHLPGQGSRLELVPGQGLVLDARVEASGSSGRLTRVVPGTAWVHTELRSAR